MYIGYLLSDNIKICKPEMYCNYWIMKNSVIKYPIFYQFSSAQIFYKGVREKYFNKRKEMEENYVRLFRY